MKVKSILLVVLLLVLATVPVSAQAGGEFLGNYALEDVVRFQWDMGESAPDFAWQPTWSLYRYEKTDYGDWKGLVRLGPFYQDDPTTNVYLSSLTATSYLGVTDQAAFLICGEAQVNGLMVYKLWEFTVGLPNAGNAASTKIGKVANSAGKFNKVLRATTVESCP